MSDFRQERIKKLYQKGSAIDPQFYPIGTDGQFVDMLSTLDLEEQLKIGGNCLVTMQDDENAFIVTEKYYNTSDKQNRTAIWTVVTTVRIGQSQFIYSNTNENNEDQVIYDANNGEEEELINESKESSALDLQQEQDQIEVKLYRGEQSTGILVYSKIINIDVNGNTIVDEILNKETNVSQQQEVQP